MSKMRNDDEYGGVLCKEIYFSLQYSGIHLM